MMKVGFVRHGTTLWNKEGRAQGNTDVPLDAQGLDEARQVAERLCTDDWDVIYSSDLLRARATAEAIAHRVEYAELYFDKRLRERSGGRIEGTTETDRLAKWGSDWRSLELGMESDQQLVERSLTFLHEIIVQHKNHNILVVSHGALIKRLLVRLFPEVDVSQSLGNTAVSQVSIIDGEWELQRYNCTKHLTSIKPFGQGPDTNTLENE